MEESLSRGVAPSGSEFAFLRLLAPLHALPAADPSTALDEQRYRRFCEALGVALYTTDAEGRITFYNEAAARFWGRRPAIGELWCGSWRLFWSDGRPMQHDECPMAIALREHRSVHGMSAIAERPDGTRVEFEPYPTPLFADDGRLLGAVNVLVDVTERRRAERALQASADALAASNAVKDDFLGLVSHELRTPVTTIYGNARLLHERSKRFDEVSRDGMVADIAGDAERLLGIIENLLLLSRLQAGILPDAEPQILDHVVREEVRSFMDHHEPVSIQLHTELDRHVIVDADRTYLAMLIQNLLSNAHKYAGAAGPIEVTLTMGGTAAGAEAVVCVLDRGPGFSGVEPAALFTPFYRTPEAQRTAAGIGLGLAVCERLVTALGGRIWAAPRDGGGAVFGFGLPIAHGDGG